MPREDVPGPGEFGPVEDHRHTMEELRCKSRLVTVIRERDDARAQAEALAEAVERAPHASHCEAGASLFPGPCSCWKCSALRAYRSSQESSDAS